MSFKTKIYIDRCIVDNDDWKMFAATPLDKNPDIVLNNYGNISLVGSNLSFLTVGNNYEVELSPKEHPKYGVNYVVTQIPMLKDIENMTPEQNFQLMCEVTTVQQATYVQEIYPNFVKLVLEGKKDEIDYSKIYNVGEAYFNLYCTEIENKFSFFRIRANFKEYNFNEDECKKLSKQYQELSEITNRIQDIPYYMLSQFLGRDFERTDELLLKLRPDLKESDQRCESCMYSILTANEFDGNTRMDANTMVKYVPENCHELVPRMKEIAIESKWIHYDEETKKIGVANTYTKEAFISDTFKKLLNEPRDLGIDWKKCTETDEIKLTEEQSELLRMANESNLALLLGNSGSGKTSSVQALIEMLEVNNLSYTLLAPTGISAKRLAEATQREASTIHRKIGTSLLNPIYSDFVILDEISICGVEHLYMVCKAIDPKYTKLILVGDNAQLASIACGNILEDIINSELIPSAKLNKIFRYGKGSLTTIATDIRQGKQFIKNNGELCFEGAGNDNQFEFIPIENPLEQVLQVYDRLLETYKPKDILILSPWNKGNFGTRAINDAIQEIYNPSEFDNDTVVVDHTSFEIKFRTKDRVLNTSNNYQALTYAKYEKQQELDRHKKGSKEYEDLKLKIVSIPDGSVFNGDIGTIRQVEENGKALVVQIDEELLVYRGNKNLKSLLLGNAISIHKIQGSAAKAIILLTHSSHQNMLTNNLMYVGATRSEEKLVWIGDIETVNKGLTVHETLHRDTWLLDLLKNPNYIITDFEEKGDDF